MYLLIKEPVCDTVDDKRLTDFKTPLRLRAGGVIIFNIYIAKINLLYVVFILTSCNLFKNLFNLFHRTHDDASDIICSKFGLCSSANEFSILSF